MVMEVQGHAQCPQGNLDARGKLILKGMTSTLSHQATFGEPIQNSLSRKCNERKTGILLGPLSNHNYAGHSTSGNVESLMNNIAGLAVSNRKKEGVDLPCENDDLCTTDADGECAFSGSTRTNNILKVDEEEKEALIEKLKQRVLSLEDEMDHMWSFFPECCQSIEE